MAKYFVFGFEGSFWQICKVVRYEKPSFPSYIIEIMNFQHSILAHFAHFFSANRPNIEWDTLTAFSFKTKFDSSKETGTNFRQL